jgi:hypothetical protein
MGVSGQHHTLVAGVWSLQYLLSGGWLGLRASVDVVEKRKISCPCQESNLDFLAVQAVAHCYIS